MVADGTISPAGGADRRFTAAHAREIADCVLAARGPRKVLIDLRAVDSTSTAALATLILLRRSLLQTGRDLRITGLRGRAMALYEISRLDHLLPQVQRATA
jgi:anti-anti-sigma factor